MEKIIAFAKSQKGALPVAVLLHALLYSLVFVVLTPQYATIDDLEMQLVVAGEVMVPESSPFLRFSQYPIGWLLQQLYEWMPSCPWYGLYLYAAHFTADVVLLWLILRRGFTAWRIGIYLLVWLGMSLYFLQQLQFTSAAVHLALAGGWMLFDGLQRGRKSPYWIAFAFLLFASWMRWHAFLLALLLLLPAFLSLFAFRPKQWRRTSLVMALMLLLPSLSFWMNRSIQHQQPGWEAYSEQVSSKVLSGMLDFHWKKYAYGPETAPIYDSLGWSKNDYQLVNRWFFADSSLIRTERLKGIKAAFAERSNQDWQQWPKKIVLFLTRMPPFPYRSIALLLVLAFLLPKEKRQQSTFWATVAWGLLICFALLLFRHLPPRVYFPIFASFFGFALLWMRRPTRIYIFLLLAWLAWPNVKSVWKQSESALAYQQKGDAALAQLKPQDHQLYAAGAWHYIRGVLTPLRSLGQPHIKPLHILDFGHFAGTPNYYKQLRAFDVENIHRDMVDSEHLFFVLKRGHPFLPLYQTYLRERHGLKVRFEEVHHFAPFDLLVYRLRSLKQ